MNIIRKIRYWNRHTENIMLSCLNSHFVTLLGRTGNGTAYTWSCGIFRYYWQCVVWESYVANSYRLLWLTYSIFNATLNEAVWNKSKVYCSPLKHLCCFLWARHGIYRRKHLLHIFLTIVFIKLMLIRHKAVKHEQSQQFLAQV